MKKIYISILTAVAVFVCGCDWHGTRGNGNVVTDTRTIGQFSNVEASGGLQIEWRPGSPTLSVTTDNNLLPYIDTTLIGNKLRIHTREHLMPTHGIKVVIVSQSLNAAKLTGAVRLTANEISGAKLFLESTGASHITLRGTVGELLADMTGASRLEAKELQTKTAEISTTGAANADVAVTDTLRVSITGAGKVTYSGNPPTIEKHITGAGSIRHKE